MADRWLNQLQALIDSGEFRQRALNRDLITSYANDMVRGRWAINHQGIAFDERGRLQDGQHRLWAIIRADIPVTMMVTTGLPASTNGKFNMPTMDTIDCGKNRTVGQRLLISHEVHGANKVASAVRNIAVTYTNNPHLKLTMPQVLEILGMYERDIQGIFNYSTHARQRVGPVVGPLAVYRNSFTERANEFARGYFTKENLPKGSPILALIKWIELHPEGGKEAMVAKLKAAAYCIHQFHTDQEADMAVTRDEPLYWLAALNKKHGEIIREMVNPLKK